MLQDFQDQRVGQARLVDLVARDLKETEVLLDHQDPLDSLEVLDSLDHVVHLETLEEPDQEDVLERQVDLDQEDHLEHLETLDRKVRRVSQDRMAYLVVQGHRVREDLQVNGTLNFC